LRLIFFPFFVNHRVYLPFSASCFLSIIKGGVFLKRGLKFFAFVFTVVSLALLVCPVFAHAGIVTKDSYLDNVMWGSWKYGQWRDGDHRSSVSYGEVFVSLNKPTLGFGNTAFGQNYDLWTQYPYGWQWNHESNNALWMGHNTVYVDYTAKLDYMYVRTLGQGNVYINFWFYDIWGNAYEILLLLRSDGFGSLGGALGNHDFQDRIDAGKEWNLIRYCIPSEISYSWRTGSQDVKSICWLAYNYGRMPHPNYVYMIGAFIGVEANNAWVSATFSQCKLRVT